MVIQLHKVTKPQMMPERTVREHQIKIKSLCPMTITMEGVNSIPKRVAKGEKIKIQGISYISIPPSHVVHKHWLFLS